MRSPFEKLEEWLFKVRRRSPFVTFIKGMGEARRFKQLVEKTKCPTCKSENKLELVKFERGPKGWEADIICSNCTFKAIVSGLSTVLLDLNSKGKAVRKTTTKAPTT